MRKHHKLNSALIIALSLAFLIFYGCVNKGLKKVCIRSVCVYAEVADSLEKCKRGLMFRKSIPANGGMLFIFKQEGIYKFWMKNTQIPLDIIWIDERQNIVEIKKNVLPCRHNCESIIPAAGAKYVLEVNAGLLDREGIKIGDRADF